MSVNPNKQHPNRIIIYLALAALLALGLWLRLRFIHTVRLYPDEFVTLLAVQMIGEKGVPVMPSGLFYDHGLLFSYVGSLAALFGPARLAVRYASLFFGLLTLGLTFFVGRRWFSPAVGLIAITGLVVAPPAIHWSGRARMYALLQLLVLLALWFAYEGVVHNRASWRWATLLTYLGATLTQFASVVLALPLVLAVVVTWLRRQSKFLDKRRWRIWLEAAALLLILVVAFLVKRVGQPKGIVTFEPANTLSGLAQVFTIYSSFSLNLADGWQAIAPFYLALPALIFAPFALVAVVGVWRNGSLAGWKFDRKSSSPAPPLPGSPVLFLTLILLTTTFEMILFVSPDRRDHKYLFMLLPALFLLGAQGMVVVGRYLLAILSRQKSQTTDHRLYPRYPGGHRWHRWHKQTTDYTPDTPDTPEGTGGTSRPRTTDHESHPPLHPSPLPHLLSLLSPLLISGLILTATRPAVQSLLSNLGDDYDGAFAYVQEHWQLGDTILTGTPTAAALYLGHNDFYSVQRRGDYDYRILTVADQPVDRWLGSPAIRTEDVLHQTLASHNVWLVLERWGLQRGYYDLPFQQQLLAQTDYVGETQGIFILRSKPDPRPIVPNPAHPTEAVFGNIVRSRGYTVEPEKPASGQTVRLTLYWQALAPMPHDYTVFVHLRHPEGGHVAQADHRPLGSLYPTTVWPVGETIRETSDLFLPPDLPPGDYDLWGGLYLLETGERLPVQNDTSGENAVKLGVLRVAN